MPRAQPTSVSAEIRAVCRNLRLTSPRRSSHSGIAIAPRPLSSPGYCCARRWRWYPSRQASAAIVLLRALLLGRLGSRATQLTCDAGKHLLKRFFLGQLFLASLVMPVLVFVAASSAADFLYLVRCHRDYRVVGGALATRAVIVNVIA